MLKLAVIVLIMMVQNNQAIEVCRKCIKCLEVRSLKNGRERLPEEKFSPVHHDTCPKRGDVEYSYLQQVQYMYRDVTYVTAMTSRVPCAIECLLCKSTVRRSGCQIEELKKSYLETMFGGVFFSDGKKYLPPHSIKLPDSKITNPIRVNTTEGYQRRVIPRSRPGCNGCNTQPHISAFFDNLVIGGTPWYAVFFNFPTLNCQYYEYVSCGSSSCITKDTGRHFLMTTVSPQGRWGHSFTLFNHYLFQNVKFQRVEFAGYCEYESP